MQFFFCFSHSWMLIVIQTSFSVYFSLPVNIFVDSVQNVNILHCFVSSFSAYLRVIICVLSYDLVTKLFSAYYYSCKFLFPPTINEIYEIIKLKLAKNNWQRIDLMFIILSQCIIHNHFIGSGHFTLAPTKYQSHWWCWKCLWECMHGNTHRHKSKISALTLSSSQSHLLWEWLE